VQNPTVVALKEELQFMRENFDRETAALKVHRHL
jgi:hypothetical protein